MAVPVLALAVWIFLAVRLCCAFPRAVLEKRPMLATAWQLKPAGNFWQLLFTMVLGGLLPMLLALTVLALPFQSTASPESGDVSEALIFFEQELRALPTHALIQFASTIMGGALTVGLLCYAFKALSDRRSDMQGPNVFRLWPLRQGVSAACTDIHAKNPGPQDHRQGVPIPVCLIRYHLSAVLVRFLHRQRDGLCRNEREGSAVYRGPERLSRNRFVLVLSARDWRPDISDTDGWDDPPRFPG